MFVGVVASLFDFLGFVSREEFVLLLEVSQPSSINRGKYRKMGRNYSRPSLAHFLFVIFLAASVASFLVLLACPQNSHKSKRNNTKNTVTLYSLINET